MSCKNCGKENENTDKFCSFCGARLEEDVVQQEEIEPQKKKSKKWLYVILTIVVLFFIGVGVFLMLQMSKSEKDEKQYEVYLEEGEKYLLALEYDKAEDVYLKAIDIDSKKVKPYVQLADVYMKQERYEDAKDILNQAKEQAEHPRNESTWTKEEKEEYEKIDGLLEQLDILDKITWVVEPTIEAEDIFYMQDCNLANDYTNNLQQQWMEHTIIKRQNKYDLISMEGSLLSDEFCDSVYNYNRMISGYIGDMSYGWNGKNFDVDYAQRYGLFLYSGCFIDNKLYFVSTGDVTNVVEPVDLDETIPVYKIIDKIEFDSDGYIETDVTSRPPYAIYSNGKLVTDFIYQECGSMQDGLLAVKKDNKWGYVDANGKEIIPIEYDASWNYCFQDMFDRSYKDYCYASSEGYIPLVKDNVWEMRNSKGELVIPAGMFEAIRPVYQGKCWVKKEGKWGVIALEHKQEEAKEITSSTNSENSLTEEELKENLQRMTSVPIGVFRYDDYDGDGKKEAFAVTSDSKIDEVGEENEMEIISATVWFIDHKGTVEQLLHEYGFCPDEKYANGNPKTFLWEMSGGGSSSITYVWCVKDGKVYEPKVSRDIMAFSYDNIKRKYIAFDEYFTDEGHQYDELSYKFDEKTGEFIQD